MDLLRTENDLQFISLFDFLRKMVDPLIKKKKNPKYLEQFSVFNS